MHKDEEILLLQMEGALAPSTGCTEPSALALNAATARRHAQGEIRSIDIRLDAYLFKNAMVVGIPGADTRGVPMCVALGVTAGDADAGLDVLHTVTPQALEKAKALLDKIHLSIADNVSELFIETTLETDSDCVRVITYRQHDNIVDISHPPFTPFSTQEGERPTPVIQRYTLDHFLDLAATVPLERLAFLRKAVAMNTRIYEKGESLRMERFIAPGGSAASASDAAKRMAGTASYARMSGVPLPVMTATGSGNQGITLYLTMEAVARHLGIDEEEKLRAMALASLVNIYIKSFIGELSSVCACGVSSGLAASMGVVRMLGGGKRNMLLAARNVLGSISGMICDGAKEGCANKVALSAGLAVESALMAVEDVGIGADNGILDESFEGLVSHLAQLVNVGMGATNRTIVDIMLDGAQ